MIYVVNVKDYSGGDRVYILFETDTESFFGGGQELLQKLVNKNKMSIINANITSKGVSIKQWYRVLHRTLNIEVESGTDYVLLCQIDEDTYKLVSYDECVIYVSTEELYGHVMSHKVANCRLNGGKFESIGTYSVPENMQFKLSIAAQYSRYTAMTALLGRKMSFDYIIEGDDVKLKRYTGSAIDVIVPKFITSIMQRAFVGSGVATVTLDEGLESIGYYAFQGCNLSTVIIPKTVKFIGTGAFYNNKRMVMYNGMYKKGKLKLLSEKTQMLDIYQSDTLL